MFATLIQYRLNPIFKADFYRYWQEHRQYLLDQGIIRTSILHRETPISYISYTRWDSRESFENNILEPTGEIKLWQDKIEDCCNDVRVLHRMDIIQKVSKYEK